MIYENVNELDDSERVSLFSELDAKGIPVVAVTNRLLVSVDSINNPSPFFTFGGDGMSFKGVEWNYIFKLVKNPDPKIIQLFNF